MKSTKISQINWIKRERRSLYKINKLVWGEKCIEKMIELVWLVSKLPMYYKPGTKMHTKLKQIFSLKIGKYYNNWYNNWYKMVIFGWRLTVFFVKFWYKWLMLLCLKVATFETTKVNNGNLGQIFIFVSHFVPEKITYKWMSSLKAASFESQRGACSHFWD